MKRIAKTLLIAALASAASGAIAAENSFPTPTRPDSYSQTDVFPNMPTYESEHHASALQQASTPYPASVPEEYSLASEFPGTVTYKQEHRYDPVQASNTATFPENLPAEPSMADEGLVPGIAGVAPYVDTRN